MTGALVRTPWPNPRVIEFRGGPRYPHEPFGPTAHALYTPPRDTMDPRYRDCTDHHPACDCREAEWAEDRHEYRAQYKDIQDAFDEALKGHATRTYDGSRPCQCIGCRIARDAHIYPRLDRA